MKRILGIMLGVLIAYGGWAMEREKSKFNSDWDYLEQPVSTWVEANQQAGWERIDLPHTWNATDVMDQAPGYRRNASWYKKSFEVERLSEGDRYFLYFEGANITTEVYINGNLATTHIGGYIGFEAEMTTYLVEGVNTVSVRVDNSYDRQIIPSQKSDFFIYGGITRDVWLVKTHKTRVSSVQVSTPAVSESSASTLIDVTLDGTETTAYTVRTRVTDPKGKVVYDQETAAKATQSIDFEIRKPKLWDVNNPQLYQVQVELIKDGKVVDTVDDRYGYRWFEFTQNGPFYLNGKRLLLRGTHRHEESAGIGAALPNEMHRQDMEMIKGMGANFVRLAHYPQDPEIYKACDELGILVWDELPWCRGGVGDDTWKTNTKNLLTEMIDQNYNHPSVILWSLGNEIYWLPDFENGDDEEEVNAFLSELNDLSHELDPGRKTSIRKYYAGADIVDVFSPSIWSGWYSGTYKGYENALEKSLAKYDHFLHMEYGGSSFVGRHSENPITGDGEISAGDWEEPINQVEYPNIANDGDWSENYIVDLFDWYLSISESHDQFAGSAQWAFKDFGTPLRPENDIPYLNEKGLADRSGKPKDAYYVFKSYWSDEPFVYIESHTWTERSGPEGKTKNISVFSNNETVELILNGKSLGKKTRDMSQYPACGLNWDVEFQEGENVFEAIGYKGRKVIATDSLLVSYSFEQAGAPDQIVLAAERLDNGHYLVSARAIDKKGLRCLDYEDRAYFQCLAGGELVKDQGTPTGSEVINMANGRAAIEVIPDPKSKKLVMGVYNQNFKGTYLEIDLKDINP
ncbi:glycoside hydrolase family 2 protein [Reichenbachiella agariperforans]|uniref:glycoside hydrolase family 2 protein n=1 Tax=Reichenbachiella agariperforans TaxID=156994 RepID=UPI001C0A46D0|nr:glycoside hydrolase family 2 TIM barrel-domain containing protein [Reichenbachiella agariperforans]MBU2914322.1 glycoside hydrolase family 2 protein [Reichenbachiella agariperforans]